MVNKYWPQISSFSVIILNTIKGSYEKISYLFLSITLLTGCAKPIPLTEQSEENLCANGFLAYSEGNVELFTAIRNELQSRRNLGKVMLTP